MLECLLTTLLKYNTYFILLKDIRGLVPQTKDFEQCWKKCCSVYEVGNKGLLVINTYVTECLEAYGMGDDIFLITMEHIQQWHPCPQISVVNGTIYFQKSSWEHKFYYLVLLECVWILSASWIVILTLIVSLNFIMQNTGLWWINLVLRLMHRSSSCGWLKMSPNTDPKSSRDLLS